MRDDHVHMRQASAVVPPEAEGGILPAVVVAAAEVERHNHQEVLQQADNRLVPDRLLVSKQAIRQRVMSVNNQLLHCQNATISCPCGGVWRGNLKGQRGLTPILDCFPKLIWDDQVVCSEKKRRYHECTWM